MLQETPEKSKPDRAGEDTVARPGTQRPPFHAELPQGSEASSLMPEGEGRQDRWNAVMGAVKDNLPSMIQSVATPRKARRIPDEKDPEPRPQPVRLPLHPTIPAALEACRRVAQSPDSGDLSKPLKIDIDRKAPGRSNDRII